MQVFRAKGVLYAVSVHRSPGSKVKYFENLPVNSVPLTGQMYCGKRKNPECSCLFKYKGILNINVFEV